MQGLRLSPVFGLLGLLTADSAAAQETTNCSTLASDTRFVDLAGNAVDPETVDAIAFREMDGGTVLIYRRTSADADALVQRLATSGESDSTLLRADAWLMAQVASCKMRRAQPQGQRNLSPRLASALTHSPLTVASCGRAARRLPKRSPRDWRCSG